MYQQKKSKNVSFKKFFVAVGSVVNLLIHPCGALIIGTLSGILSVIGYRYITVSNTL